MLVALLLMAAAAGSPAKQMPVDQCRDPSFAAFRSRFEQIVKKKDFEGLVALVAPDAEIYMSGSAIPSKSAPTTGKAGFRSKFNNGRDPSLWHNLTAILRLGCVSSEESRTFPSVPDGLDIEEYLVVVPGAPLLEAASSKSPVKAHLSWDVLTDLAPEENAAYVHVRLRDGRTGYVRRDQLRSEYYDDNIWFEKRHGRWVITAYDPTEP
jgi:hypothetical protein